MRAEAVRSGLKRVPGLARVWRGLRAAHQRWQSWKSPGAARKRTAAYWGGEATARPGDYSVHPSFWLTSNEVLRDYVFPRFGGVDWYTYVHQRYCPAPRKLGLSLCCGNGHVERILLWRKIVAACEGVDLSPECIAACRQEAQTAGLTGLRYRVADVERMRLPRNRYDLVVGWMALHHLQNLPRVFAQVRRSLTRDGILLVNEYVGPARFRIPQSQVDLMNEWLARLPDQLKRELSGEVRQRAVPLNLEDLVAHDPSEAICSDQILPLISREFEVVEEIPYGGALLQLLLGGIIQNFDPGNREHCHWLQKLYAAEREAMERGELDSDFAFVIARARRSA